jgi:dipeptidase D
MSPELKDLKPELLWKHFERILAIPHCSGNEKALGEYVMSVASNLGLESKRDRAGNVVVRKPAAAGREKAAGVVLQGHLDMVGEKNADTVHDFAKDAIKAEVAGEWVKAKGTTLGADNGVGVAASLAVMEDKSLVHGPLEFLFTVDEETGLTGANNLARNVLTGSMLLNLDSEDEGTFTIGCAGGADTELELPVARKKNASKSLWKVGLTGFRGGHSGIDINQGRGNAIKLLARILAEVQNSVRFELVSLSGGSKRNAIAREAWAVVACQPAQAKTLQNRARRSFENIKAEYKAVEKEAVLTFEAVKDRKEYPLARESQETLVKLLLALPHGVLAMHQEIKGLVETSTNLAIVETTEKSVKVVCNTRSSVGSALEAARLGIKSVAELAGARAALEDGYPGWTPNLESPLLKKMKELYSRMFGVEPEVVAVHAGLECGIIGKKYPGMDMISLGPTIKNPHSPDERVHIGSVEKFWKFLCSVLTELA